MIIPAEIRQKALKLWESGKVLQSALLNEPLFPQVISFRKPNARQQLEEFAAIRTWVEQLKRQSREVVGHGYDIVYKTIQHRQLGEQRLPDRIVFPTQDDLLRFVRKHREFEQQHATALASIARYPALRQWITDRPRQFAKHHAEWHSLLAVCECFLQHPRPDCYVRELDIPGIDSKFIEQHKGILSELLDGLLPAAALDATVTGTRHYGFERRYGLKYQEAVLRLRLLDSVLYPMPGVSDLSLPLSQLNQWPIPCDTVFVTENKVNGLSFPDVAGALVIFGLGYGVDSLAEIEWLREKRLIYWGDIDTHGLSILSRLRRHFPAAQALLMDETTLTQYARLCVEEPGVARCHDKLTYLTPVENALYQQLQQSHQRLEQERIPMRALRQALAAQGLNISDQ